MTHVHNEGSTNMLPAVSAPAFENSTGMGLKLCAATGGWSTKSPTPQPAPMWLSARSHLRPPAWAA